MKEIFVMSLKFVYKYRNLIGGGSGGGGDSPDKQE